MMIYWRILILAREEVSRVRKRSYFFFGSLDILLA